MSVEIDEKELREFLLSLWESIEAAQLQVNAYQVAASVLRAAGIAEEFDLVFRQSLQHPSPDMSARLQAGRDTIEKFLAGEKLDRQALQFLKAWKPKGPAQ